MLRGARHLLAALAALMLLPHAASAAAPQLQVGVGRADITPPTGYYMMGWVRSDGVISGQHTRLWARAIVLQEGDRKIALVAEDLNGIPGGVMAQAAALDSDIGFNQENVLDSASHTHAAPTSFYNFSTYNSVFMTLRSPTDFDLAGSVDPQLYAFMVRQLALAIRRANANLGPGKVGWGATQIDDLTENRSIEAHLYDHGIHLPYGQGRASMDPMGVLHTIDPNASVLRADKLIGGRDVPVGMWSTFANHGTVNKYQFTYYNEDHHGAATHVVEDAIRRIGNVPPGQDVVNAYGNSDEGDISSGLHRSGPAAADYVGTAEADAFMRAWRQAGQSMSSSPALDYRWTRMCWCGQDTPDGPVSDKAAFGVAEFTGSEEGRGPLFDATRIPFEGDHLPVGMGAQGDKAQAPLPLDVPKAVPMMAVRIGDRLIVSVPGEMTEDMGRRVKARRDAGGGRLGHRRRGDLRPGERVRRLLHDPAGVRRPALRGRRHGLRAGERGRAGAGAGGPVSRSRVRHARAGGLPLRPDQRAVRRRKLRAVPDGAGERDGGRPAGRARPGDSGTRASPGRAGSAASTGRSTAPSCSSSARPAAAGRRSTRTSG